MKVSEKLGRVSNGYYHWCPGCESMHILPDSWAFDGNVESPTFSPSFLHLRRFNEKDVPCHYFVTAGKLHGDCHHKLANTVIDIPPIPYEY